MNATRLSARRLLVPALIAIATVTVSTATVSNGAEAQLVVAGETRVQMSDVTGPNVGSLLLFETGTTKTFACPVAWGVRTTAQSLADALRAGNLEITTATGVERAPSAEAQRRVLALLQGDDDAAAAAVEAALAAPSDGEVTEEAGELVEELEGLFAAASGMDPSDPGYRAATGLADAIHQFNDYVDDAALTSPPDEFLVIETVLSRLVLSALENDGRQVDDASRDGAYGLPCAPPVAMTTPPPAPPAPVPPPAEPPVVERPITVCVLTNGRIEYVPAILVPETSDTLAIRGGERVRFDVVHPESGYSGHLPWAYAGETVQLGRDHFAPFGEPFVVAPTDALVPAGEYRGVTFFRRDDAPTPPDVVLLPTAPRCMVQPYRLQEDVRKSGG